MYSPSGHPWSRWFCFFIKAYLEKFSVTSFAHQWFLLLNSAFCAYFSPDSEEKTFFQAILWIKDSYFSRMQWFEAKNILMMNLFLTNMQLLITQYINWWPGVIVDYLSIGEWCNAKFLQICSEEETNSSASWMASGSVHVQQIFIFGWTFPLKQQWLIINYNLIRFVHAKCLCSTTS